jgi:hypothetical protein
MDRVLVKFVLQPLPMRNSMNLNFRYGWGRTIGASLFDDDFAPKAAVVMRG